MGKKKKLPSPPRANKEEAPATLKDLLSSEVLNKLKAQADELKNEEKDRKEAERKAAEEARKVEQKRLDNDFAHLLENSSQDWRKYK
ncbi:outer membrane murein-binding lipoprotein Lpp [Paenibacillus forsythiae]|uniref:Outer membrane murein-binding lipoprotein Lpp n=1 Tax=Paenibacillus forsythiae TaxID=365616 RepID=A0ABU3H5H4_9BACL|nr:YqkE family protein [Paenibacillus forsythiae]MDT3425975.1 outer membrane murein-binding lipoprotein Lpp [Paenibacillus forsythiae]